MNSKFRFLVLLFFCLAAALPAGGKKEEKLPVVRVSGRVRLVGSALMPEMVISGPDKEWFIEKEDMDKLYDLQQRTVTVEGVETTRTMKSGNGLFTIERRTLKNIKVIAIE